MRLLIRGDDDMVLSEPSDSLPNFVFLINDQDLTLGGISPMSHTLAFMQDGVYFKNFLVNTPICCPSKATLVSGRYPSAWDMHNLMQDQAGSH